jgi:hypothetical protein
MNDFEDLARSFLRRWSQRKRAAEKPNPDNAGLSPNDKGVDSNAAAQGDVDPPAFDPANLPSLETITATSDIRPFLGPGVPEELTRAALRRVWLADPAIRNFIGIAENQWDFTKPESIPGFGSLELTPALRRAVLSLIGNALGQTGVHPAHAEQVEQISEISGELLAPANILSPSENDGGAERSPRHTDFAVSENASADPAVAQNTNQDSINETFGEKGVSDTGENSRSIYRKHGGAVPK